LEHYLGAIATARFKKVNLKKQPTIPLAEPPRRVVGPYSIRAAAHPLIDISRNGR
jgi:hypothetical protein